MKQSIFKDNYNTVYFASLIENILEHQVFETSYICAEHLIPHNVYIDNHLVAHKLDMISVVICKYLTLVQGFDIMRSLNEF